MMPAEDKNNNYVYSNQSRHLPFHVNTQIPDMVFIFICRSCLTFITSPLHFSKKSHRTNLL